MTQKCWIGLNVLAVGASTGVLLPKEVLVRLRVNKGDTLFAVEDADGYLMTSYNPKVARQVRKGREFLKRYESTFRSLAK